MDRENGSRPMQESSGNLSVSPPVPGAASASRAPRKAPLAWCHDIARIFGRRAPLVAGVPLGAAAALAFYGALTPPQYTATASVITDVSRTDDAKPGAVAAASARGADIDVAVESQVKLIQSAAVLEDIVDRLHLAADAEFAPPSGLLERARSRLSPRASAADGDPFRLAKSRALNRLRDRLTVSRDERTLVINIAATSHDAAKAADIANTAANSYLRQPELADARLVAAAKPPVEPRPPVGWPLAGLVIAGALGAGGALAIAVDRRDRRIKTLRQLQEISGVPALAAIPQVGVRERARRTRPSREELKRFDPGSKTLLPPALQPPLMRYAYDDPTSTFADGIRAVRLAVHRAGRAAGCETVMVTSALDSEGKSTLSANLARSFAVAGARTVLVDCDLRNPEVTWSLCPRIDHGLTDAASGEVPLDRLLLYEEMSGLSILPAPPPRDFNVRTEFAFTSHFADVIARLRARFEVVVLDAPPLIPLTDSRALADHADGIILTAAWNETPREVLEEALELLGENFERVIGCVLSRVDLQRIRYYDRAYGEAYRQPYRPLQ